MRKQINKTFKKSKSYLGKFHNALKLCLIDSCQLHLINYIQCTKYINYVNNIYVNDVSINICNHINNIYNLQK